jgi:hypothetical protein
MFSIIYRQAQKDHYTCMSATAFTLSQVDSLQKTHAKISHSASCRGSRLLQTMSTNDSDLHNTQEPAKQVLNPTTPPGPYSQFASRIGQ